MKSNLDEERYQPSVQERVGRFSARLSRPAAVIQEASATQHLLAHVFVTCIAVAFTIAGTSCNRPGQEPELAELPSDWPLAELTLPAGAVRDVLPLRMRMPETEDVHMARGDAIGGRVWMIGFDCDLSYSELVEYTSEILLSLGFAVTEVDNTDPMDKWTYYDNGDDRTAVRVGYAKHVARQAVDSYGAFYYEVVAP